MSLAACGDHTNRQPPRRSPLETAIARDVTARFGVPVTASCTLAAGIPVACEAALVDGTKLPIEIRSEGKRTVLVAFALDLAGPADRAAIEARLGREDLDDAGIACLRGIFTGSGAVDRVEEMISTRADEARAALREAGRVGGLDAAALVVLGDLVGVSTARHT